MGPRSEARWLRGEPLAMSEGTSKEEETSHRAEAHHGATFGSALAARRAVGDVRRDEQRGGNQPPCGSPSWGHVRKRAGCEESRWRCPKGRAKRRKPATVRKPIMGPRSEARWLRGEPLAMSEGTSKEEET